LRKLICQNILFLILLEIKYLKFSKIATIRTGTKPLSAPFDHILSGNIYFCSQKGLQGCTKSRTNEYVMRFEQSGTMNNILILSAGRRVSLLRGFQSAAVAFKGCRIYAADVAPTLSAACNAADKAFQIPKVTSPDFKDALIIV